MPDDKNNETKPEELKEQPAIAIPEHESKPVSPIILPGAGTSEILPGDAFNKKLKLDEKTLAQLGVKSEDDLGDDICLERSPIDGACVVSAVKDKMPVCQYCFLPFVRGIPEYEPAEIQVAMPDGGEQGLRVKVHGACQIKAMLKQQKRD